MSSKPKPKPTSHQDLVLAYLAKKRELASLEAQVATLQEKESKEQDQYDLTEQGLLSLQHTGHEIGEVVRCLPDGRCIVRVSRGPRYVVGYRSGITESQLREGTRVALDSQSKSKTIVSVLPRQVDPAVFNMRAEDPGDVKYSDVGGLEEQIRELREVIELPITQPELFERVGVVAPKGVLLYGPPGTGKTLLARAVANSMQCSFLKVVSSSLVDKYIGESARLVREMFNYARDHAPCVIFIDEIDAIGGTRFGNGKHSDREVQRTLMELLNQLDGFNTLDRVKVIMATNRPDILDPALMRPGRLDRKVEIPLPNQNGRVEIIRIHSRDMNKDADVDFEAICRLADGFNGADLRNVCTEAGMFAIRDGRDFVRHEDFIKATRKIMDAKKLETKLDYGKI